MAEPMRHSICILVADTVARNISEATIQSSVPEATVTVDGNPALDSD
jgi:hypothetical protein